MNNKAPDMEMFKMINDNKQGAKYTVVLQYTN